MSNIVLKWPTFSQWANEPKWLHLLRTDAYDQYAHLDWPDARCEDWHRTPVSRFALETLKPSPSDEKLPPLETEDSASPYCGRLVIIDGKIFARSLDQELKCNFQAMSLYQAVVQEEKNEKLALTLQRWLRKGLHQVSHKVIPLHYIVMGTGALIAIPQNLTIQKPFLLQIEENRDGLLVSPHIIVNAGRLSCAQLLVKIQGRGKSVLNTRFFIQVDEGANFQLSEVQNLSLQTDWISHSSVNLSRNAQSVFWSASLGGGTVKTDSSFTLEGEGSGLDVKGMYFGFADQHRDLRLAMTHSAPRTSGSVLFKGAVRDRAHTVFQGLIEVLDKAQGANSFLSNKNLILTDGAQADSLPQLKIDNNEVKCSHGSTTGRINEEEIHYLCSRGLSRSQAKGLLAEGLFAEVIDSAPALLRGELETYIEKVLSDSPLHE